MNHEESLKKEITLKVLYLTRDRSSVTSDVLETIEVDGREVETGAPLPGWKWHDTEGIMPVVTYYDGEYLELEDHGKMFGMRVGDPQVRVIEASCGGNMYVSMSKAITVEVNKLCVPKTLPSWREMYEKGSFNALAVTALPRVGTDPVAARWFTRVFTTMQYMFLLMPQTVKLIEASARTGNALALFALGRYHLCVMPEPDSRATAMECFGKAWEKDLPEAAVALAMAYDYGDIGMVDRQRAKELLETAIGMECDYAAEYYVRKMMYGLRGVEADPLTALEVCNRLIASDTESYGAEEVNPKWIYFKGCAIQAAEGWAHGGEEFQKAADMGYIPAWMDLAVALSHNDEGDIVDKSANRAALRRGAAIRNASCSFFLHLDIVENFDDMSVYSQELAGRQLVIALKNDLDMGEATAAEILGDIYYYGKYRQEESNREAYKYYARGALLNDPECYEKMYDMIDERYIEASQDTQDMIGLFGARLESKKLMAATVAAYGYGRLTEFAQEIEQLYVPIVDKEEADGDEDDDAEPCDEPNDDDGRFDPYV